MAKLKLISTIFSKLGSLTKNNGQIIVTRDSKSLYVDLESERIEITNWIDVDTEENLLAILTPLTNKYYYTKDNNKIWRYINNDWKCLNTSVNDLTPTYTESSTLVKLSSGEKLSIAFGKISKAITDLISHIGDSVKHITSTERTNWNSAKTHADSTHAPADAQKNVQSDWSATSGDAYIKNKPTEFPPSIHTHPKSEISDFPSSLPASGGNADTVNNHTVKSNVPTDAVFTDTIYDDTEVKGSIAKLSSNLDGLQYSDVAGGKNLFDKNSSENVDGWLINGIPNGETTYNQKTSHFIRIDGNTFVYNKGNVNNKIAFYDSNKTFISEKNQVTDVNVVTMPTNAKYVRVVYFDVEKDLIQIEEDTTATNYKPYIPSVKMLADESSQQSNNIVDLKMLGWSVPKECPVQNYVDSDGVFHQIVGRVDLGSLNWRAFDSTRFISKIETAKAFDDSIKANAFCKSYKVVSRNNVSSINMSIGIDDAKNVWLRNNSYTDAAELKNSLQGVYLYYELETPITKTIDGNEAVAELKNDLIVLETTSMIDMSASRELDDITSATLTIPSGYKPIAMFGYNEENNDNVSAIPLLVRSDGKVLFHAKNHSTSDQGIIHFRIRVTFKKMS